MASAKPLRVSACILWLLLLSLPYSSSSSSSSSIESSNEHSLDIAHSAKLQLSHGMPVKKSPGSKPGTSVVCERVHIRGLSRLKNLGKFAHMVKVKVSGINSSIHVATFEVCFHRNASLGIGMCPHNQWEKAAKGSWSQSMSPFANKLLDLRTAASSLETYEVSIEEEFFTYRIIFLILGIIMMSLASPLSGSLVFYYSSAMAIGVVLVILMVLFQGMKLLPTGRRNSLAVFVYSSLIGLGSFLLRYIPGLLRTILTEMGISEDMYNPLAIFLLAFVILAGAWLGFWAVRKLVLTEDGSIDISTSQFVFWSIRILAATAILQSSSDLLLAAEALIFGIIVSSILRRIFRWRFLRRMYRKLLKSPKKNSRRLEVPDSPEYAPDEYMYTSEYAFDEYICKAQSKEDFESPRPQSKNFSLASCNSSGLGSSRRTPRSQPSESGLYPSAFHTTPERRNFSKDEWEKFTRDSTEKALVELASSPDFGKWLVSNAERISITPNSTRRADDQRRWWLF